MTPLNQMSYSEIDDLLRAKGITCTYRTGEDNKVWVVQNGTERPATQEETLLHVASVDAYHLEEAENDCI
jgi:hypothetical protein